MTGGSDLETSNAGGVTILGLPRQQGSKIARVFTPKGGGRPRASVVDDNKPELRAWRVQAAEAIRTAHPGLTAAAPIFPVHEPVALSLQCVFPLRVTDQATIRRLDREDQAAGTLTAHRCVIGCRHLPWHTVTPDKDKITRAVFDALKLGHVWHDDAQCCRFEVIAYRDVTPRVVVRWAPIPG